MKKAFTLFELIIYISLVSLVMVGITTFAIDVNYAAKKTELRIDLKQNAYFAVERILNEIRSANALNDLSSTFDVHPGVLSLAMDDAGENPTVFDINSNTLRVRQGAGSPINLTLDDYEVTNLIFRNLSVSNRSNNIKVELTLRHANAAQSNLADAEISVESSAQIREQGDVTSTS